MARISGAGFASGLMAGMQLGQKVRDGWDESDLADAMKGATQQQQTQVEFSPDQQAQMNELSKPVADGAMPPMDINVGAGKEITKTVDRQFGSSADKMAAMREAGIAHLLSKGKAEKAMDWQAKAEQARLAGLQIKGAEREEDYASNIKNIMGELPGANAAPGEHLAFGQKLLGYQAKHGKVNPNDLFKFGEYVKGLKKEGYQEALALAQRGASPEAIAQKFGEYGSMTVDPRSISLTPTSVDLGGGKKQATYILNYKDEKGNSTSINALQELDRLKAADNIFDRAHKALSADNQAKQIGISGGHLALAREEKNQARAEKEAKATAAVNYYKGEHQNATPVQLEAVRRGVLAAIPKEDNSTVEYKTNNMGGGTAVLKTKTGTVTVPIRDDGKQGAPIVFSKAQFQQALKAANAPAQAAQEGALPPKEKRVTGTVYSFNGKRGVWTGTGWAPAP
jgi:hypothetical protein